MSQYFDSAAWVKKHTDYDQAQQALAIGKQELDVNQMKIDLAHKAMAATDEVAELLKKIPNIDKMASDNPSELLAIIASAQISSGQVEAGGETLAKAASAAEASSKSVQAKTEDNIKAGEALSASMRGVEEAIRNGTNPKVAWERADMQLRSMLTGPEHMAQLDMLRGLPQKSANFDYLGAARQLAAAGTKAVDQANIEQSKAAAEYSRQQAASAKAEMETLLPARVKAEEALAYQRTKAGDATTAGAAATLTDAKNRIQTDFDIEDPFLNQKAMQVAEDARALQLSQPGMGRTAALEAAYQAAKQDGLFAGSNPKSTNLGSSLSNPRSLPIVEGDLDVSRMKPNNYYVVPQGFGAYSGKTLLWDGKAFQPVKKVGH